jgi:hypothetical protein
LSARVIEARRALLPRRSAQGAPSPERESFSDRAAVGCRTGETRGWMLLRLLLQYSGAGWSAAGIERLASEGLRQAYQVSGHCQKALFLQLPHAAPDLRRFPLQLFEQLRLLKRPARQQHPEYPAPQLAV